MTGDGDDRVAALSEKLWGLIEAVVEMLVDDPKPKGADAVGKRVRELGGIIRMTKTLVSLTKPHTAAPEDEMSDSDSGPFEPGERERLLAEIERNTEHLERLLERKQAEAAARRAARAANDAQDDAMVAFAPVSSG